MRESNMKIVLKQIYRLLFVSFFTVHLLVEFIEKDNMISPLLLIMSMLFFYLYRIKNYNLSGNPIRFFLPVTILSYFIAYISIMIVILSDGEFVYSLSFLGYAVKNIPKAMTNILFPTFIYILFLDIGYGRVNQRKHGQYSKIIITSWALIVNLTFLVLNSVFYIYVRDNTSFPTIIKYIGSNLLHFNMLFWVMPAIALMTKQKLNIKVIAILNIVIIGIFGILSITVLGMRNLLITPFLVYIITYLSITEKINYKRLIIVGIVFVFVFQILTNIKFTGESILSISIDDFLTSFVNIFYRSTAFHADALALSNYQVIELLNSKSSMVVYELLEGLPFSSILAPIFKPDLYPLTIQLNWISAGRFVLSSFGLSAFTAIRYGFGYIQMVFFAIMVGYMHGRVSKWVTSQSVSHSYVIVHVIFIQIYWSTVTGIFTLWMLFYPILYIYVYNMLLGNGVRNIVLFHKRRQL